MKGKLLVLASFQIFQMRALAVHSFEITSIINLYVLRKGWMGCPLGYGTAEGGPAIAALDATLDAKVVGRYGDEWLPAPNFLVNESLHLMHWTTAKYRTCIRGAHQRRSSMAIAETGA